MEQKHNLHDHNADSKLWVYVWILQYSATCAQLCSQGSTLPAAESGQRALNMPRTNSQGAAKDKT